ncbi:MAG: hypothetical protein EWV58_08290 [Microcystis aeruginosa Ma_MB_F_20061100_S19]|uniref:hypothetical protein n=1 Tax=Microcystis aeruginosa TaxID=1126 RepID=UPI00039B5AA2|nr:hypothetical protein [Microcystis aeruginosa]NCR99128.1 hypothetical protein [Microcystis aeruginosa L311-01]OCY15389.1 MAG: hypothetical protein BEV12_15155 [Microcystis aeruginosa CACIAM 03]TRU16080.1 MAG: hypothetical protein EWV58_08290 [Microcystis aeruginosa Ma_MB_F_20061100_S19]TRU16803.1 MAG: hypothetical protein EWV59_01375 [Microcystis aeruginosa Ma_MB_F_20061100_S19D]
MKLIGDISPSLDLFLLLFFWHCLIGAIATVIAINKGYPRLNWLIFGLLGGTFTFFIALSLKKSPKFKG